MRPYTKIFFCRDFNAQHTCWVCFRSTPRGSALYETSLTHDLVSINESCPTYVPGSGVSSRNIDLIFYPLSLSHLARVDVVSDPFGSNHLPVVMALEMAVSAVSKPTCRIIIREVSWAQSMVTASV